MTKSELVKTQPVAITSARDKMPFEVTPFFPRLTRTGAADAPTTNGNAANTTNNGTATSADAKPVN